MESDALIRELNLLWEPVRPYLVKQIEELYGRRDGHILEIGPFSGLIMGLAENRIGRTFSIAAFPQSALDLYREETRKHGFEEKVSVIASDSTLTGVDEASVDLAIFRGAFFFPGHFRVNLRAIYTRLRSQGVGFIGGGYGKYTLPEVIQRVGKRSEQLNAEMGRVRVSLENLRDQVRSSGLQEDCEITTEGGLWVIMRK